MTLNVPPTEPSSGMSYCCLEDVFFIFSTCLCWTREFVGVSPFPGCRGSMSVRVFIWTLLHLTAFSGKGFPPIFLYISFFCSPPSFQEDVTFLQRPTKLLYQSGSTRLRGVPVPCCQTLPRGLLRNINTAVQAEGGTEATLVPFACCKHQKCNCMCVFTAGVNWEHYRSVRTNKRQAHDHIFKVFCFAHSNWRSDAFN